VYLAMNRFQVKKDKAEAFEAVWLGRQSDLPTMPGFIEFRLLKGPEREDHILYSSHTFWATETDFLDWTESEAFRKSHSAANAGRSEPMTLGHPVFEGFETVQTIDRTAGEAA